MKHKKQRYKSFLTYHYTDIRQEENGGITSDSLYGNPLYNDRTSIPILLDNAFTRNLNQTVSYTQYYDLLPSGKDSTDTSSKRHLTLGHQLSFSAGDYKFYDDDVKASAESYYDTLNTDIRGLRHYVSWRRLENEFSVSTYKVKGKEKQPRDLLRVGLIQSYDKIKQEPKDTDLNNLFIFGEWKYRPTKFLALDIYAKYGIGDAGSDYLIRGNLNLNLGKVGKFQAKILNQRYSTDILHQSLYISKRQVYQNNFVKPITTSIGATYHLPLTKTKLSVNYHLINNYVYYDTLSIPQQVSSALSVLQFVAQQDFRFGIFGMENTVALQYANDDYIRVPLLSLKNSTFVEGRVFKKVMLARLGFDFRMNTSYFADAFQSATGQFHLQDEQELKAFPAVDLFLSFKVET
ncbi:MAG: putative porin, partial [Saprospiraceae bacterium]